MFKRLIISLSCFAFLCNNLQFSLAQSFSIDKLPVPGVMVEESAPFTPLALKGLVVNPLKPLEFQFIVDTGNSLPKDMSSPNVEDPAKGGGFVGDPQQEQIKQQSNQLVKYFLAGLTIPEEELWVNLSPYEKDRMVPESLGQTDLGRDLLAQDYILKQLTASLIYPEKDLGKEFWSRVYAKAQQRFGTTNIPVNTFNKVWILPDQAQVFEHGPAAYVTKATLKVMLDEDYLALTKHQRPSQGNDHTTHQIGSQIIREIILPEIEKEVNTGKNFAPLRQIYQALILAKWYKETIQNGLLDALYTNKNKVAGVNLNDPGIREQIYERYLKAYKKGVFNYIKEEFPPLEGEGKGGLSVPRKYFSGGINRIEPEHVDTRGPITAVKSDGAMLSLKVDLLTPKDAAMNISSLISRRHAIKNLLKGASVTALMLSPKTAMAQHLLPLLRATADSNQNPLSLEEQFKIESSQAKKLIIRVISKAAEKPPEYQVWKDSKENVTNVLPILNILRRFDHDWRQAIEGKNVPQVVEELRKIHDETLKGLKQELQKHNAWHQVSGRFESPVGSKSYLSDFIQLIYSDVTDFLASQGLAIVPIRIGNYYWQQTNNMTGENSIQMAPLVGFPKIFIVHRINPWDWMGDVKDIQKEGIDILVVQPAEIVEGKEGIEDIKRGQETFAKTGQGELGQALAGRLFFRRDFLNEELDQCAKLITDNLNSGALLLYVDDLSLKQVIEGVDFQRIYPVGRKVDGPMSFDFIDMSYAASYAGMKILTQGALENILQTKQPSNAYLWPRILKTLAYHEMTHIKRERSLDHVTRLISTLTAFGKILGLSQPEIDEAENLEEMDVRLTSFGKAPDFFLVEALLNNKAWDKSGSVPVPSDREIIWAMIGEIGKDPDPLKTYGIQVDAKGLKVIPGKNNPGYAKPESTLDVETQIMAQLYRITQAPGRALILEGKIREALHLRERQEAFAKKYSYLDPWSDDQEIKIEINKVEKPHADAHSNMPEDGVIRLSKDAAMTAGQGIKERLERFKTDALDAEAKDEKNAVVAYKGIGYIAYARPLSSRVRISWNEFIDDLEKTFPGIIELRIWRFFKNIGVGEIANMNVQEVYNKLGTMVLPQEDSGPVHAEVLGKIFEDGESILTFPLMANDALTVTMGIMKMRKVILRPLGNELKGTAKYFYLNRRLDDSIEVSIGPKHEYLSVGGKPKLINGLIFSYDGRRIKVKNGAKKAFNIQITASADLAMTTAARIKQLIGELNDRGQKPKIHETDLLGFGDREEELLKFIQRYSVLKDPDDIRRLLLWRLNTLEQKGKPLSGIDANDVSLLYNSIFNQDEFLRQYAQGKPINVVLYRRGHSGSELTNLLNTIPGVNIKIILSATDDGLSWFHASREFADTGVPGVGKAILDLARDRRAKRFLEQRIEGTDGQNDNDLAQEFNKLIDHLKDLNAKSRLSDEMFRIYQMAMDLSIEQRKTFTGYMDRFKSEVEKYKANHPDSKFSYHDIPVRSIILQGGALQFKDRGIDNPWQAAVDKTGELLKVKTENRVLFPTKDRQHIVALRKDGTLYFSETGINQYETDSPFLGIWLLKQDKYQKIESALKPLIEPLPLPALEGIPSNNKKEILSTTWRVKGESPEEINRNAVRLAQNINSNFASQESITPETENALKTADVILYADAFLETNVGGAVIVKGTQEAIREASNHEKPGSRKNPGEKIRNIPALKINLAELKPDDVDKRTSLDYLERLNRYVSGDMLYKASDKWKEVGLHVDYVLGGLLGNQDPLSMTEQYVDLERQTNAQVGAVAVNVAREEEYGFFSSEALKEAIIALLGIKAAGYKIMNNGKLMPVSVANKAVAGNIAEWPKGQNGLFKTDNKVKALIGEIKRNWGTIIEKGAFVFDVDMTILPKKAEELTDFWELANLFMRLLREGVRVAIISGNSEEEQMARVHEAIEKEMKDNLEAMENLTFYVNGGATKIKINNKGEKVYDKDYNDAHGMEASVLNNAINQALLKIAKKNFELKKDQLEAVIQKFKKDAFPGLDLLTPWERENPQEDVIWNPEWKTPKEIEDLNDSKGRISVPWVEKRGEFISQAGKKMIASAAIKPVPNLEGVVDLRDELVDQINEELGDQKDKFYPRGGGSTTVDVTQTQANKPAALEDFIKTSHLGRSGNLKPLVPQWVFYLGDEFFNRIKKGKMKRGNDEDIAISKIPVLQKVRTLAINADNIEGADPKTLWIGRTPQATLEFLEAIVHDSAMKTDTAMTVQEQEIHNDLQKVYINLWEEYRQWLRRKIEPLPGGKILSEDVNDVFSPLFAELSEGLNSLRQKKDYKDINDNLNRMATLILGLSLKTGIPEDKEYNSPNLRKLNEIVRMNEFSIDTSKKFSEFNHTFSRFQSAISQRMDMLASLDEGVALVAADDQINSGTWIQWNGNFKPHLREFFNILDVTSRDFRRKTWLMTNKRFANFLVNDFLKNFDPKLLRTLVLAVFGENRIGYKALDKNWLLWYLLQLKDRQPILHKTIKALVNGNIINGSGELRFGDLVKAVSKKSGLDIETSTKQLRWLLRAMQADGSMEIELIPEDSAQLASAKQIDAAMTGGAGYQAIMDILNKGVVKDDKVLNLVMRQLRENFSVEYVPSGKLIGSIINLAEQGYEINEKGPLHIKTGELVVVRQFELDKAIPVEVMGNYYGLAPALIIKSKSVEKNPKTYCLILQNGFFPVAETKSRSRVRSKEKKIIKFDFQHGGYSFAYSYDSNRLVKMHSIVSENRDETGELSIRSITPVGFRGATEKVVKNLKTGKTIQWSIVEGNQMAQALNEFYYFKSDTAMLGVSDRAINSFPGGIDLHKINVKRAGKTISVQFDPRELNELMQGGFEGFTPVVVEIKPIQSPYALLGVGTVRKNGIMFDNR